MDTSEYMPMFLAEAREHLQELTLAIVALEDNPHDRATVAEIFRIAHSLKGMSATMGFSAIASLTHEMEEVFELLRQRSEGLSSAAIDTVLACLDALAASVDAIEADGTEALDPAELIERLHGLVRVSAEEQEAERIAAAWVPDLQAAQAAGEHVLHVRVSLADDTLMPAVRAHMVFAALAGHGILIGGFPAQSGIELFEGRQIEAWLVSEHEEEVVAASAASISDVVGVEISEARAPHDPDAELAAQTGAITIMEPVAAEPAVQTIGPAAGNASASTARTVRVDAERLDALMHSMGELVIHRTAVEALAANVDVPGLQNAMQELTRSSQALQSMVMQIRMIPVDVVFLRFPRLVRDLSAKLGKEVRLELVGRDTELDRTVVDALGDPLVHLVRNALDHGLEPSAERVAAGKSPTGTLELAARHAGGSVIIEVRDDGRGIDTEAVACRAFQAGLIDADAAADLDVKGAIELLFAAGFSTVETASDISGRGVGMDVVRTKIRELGGEVLVESTPGRGTLAQIRLPLTLAIVSALQIEIAGAPYAIPLERVERTLRLSHSTIRSVAGRRMLMVDDGVLQLLDGTETFGRSQDAKHQFVVIVRSGEDRLALAVDELVGQRELVTRPLPAAALGCEPVSGGAALADGRIALIVDCDALLVGAPRARPAAATVGVSTAISTLPAVSPLAA